MSKIFKSVDDIQPVKNNGTEKLGSGSFSKVNLVCHKQNPSKHYAMKEVALRNDKDRKLVSQEINLHMTLRHPNVIQFEDHIELPDKVFIFLEHAKNGDLFGYINKNKPNEQTLLKIFYQTCLAIEYIHSKNIMHRDLKPENILLDEDFNIKLCDFGWSAEYYEDVNRETLCGTFEYMAPEVFFRNKQTKKTDIWALGVLLYELFHGYAPFRGTRMDTVMHAIMRNVVAFKKNLPQDVKDLIIKILIFDPKKRQSIEEILQHPAILNFIKGQNDAAKEKENVEIVSKTEDSDKKSFRNKPLVFSSSFNNNNLNSPNTGAQKTQPKSFMKQSSFASTNLISNNSLLKKVSDIGNTFKKARTEDYSSTKSFNSVDKVSAGPTSFTKRYNPSSFASQHGSVQNNIYSSKPSLNQSFGMNTPSGVKIISQRIIVNSQDASKNSSSFSTYSKPTFNDADTKNIYNGSNPSVKFNFIKQKSSMEGDKSFSSHLNTPSKL